MKERPIFFCAPMIKAILSGTKSQTRRIVKPQPVQPTEKPLRHPATHERSYFDSYCSERKTPDNPRGMSNRWCWWTADDRPDPLSEVTCPYGGPGQRLWVRETYALIWPGDGPPENVTDNRVEYRADTDGVSRPGEWPEDDNDQARPKWKPSIFMPRWASRITLEVTSVRVERLQDISDKDAYAEGVNHGSLSNVVENYAHLWCDINGAASWDANPFVWVIKFRRLEAATRAA